MEATQYAVNYKVLSEAVRELWLERQKMQNLSEASSDPKLPIQEGVEEAAQKLFHLADAPREEIDEGSIEVCRILLAIDDVRTEWKKWVNWQQTTSEGPDGSKELWQAMNSLQAVYSSELKPPFVDPHMEAARTPPTSPMQIAKMLEWKDCEGPAGVVWDTPRVNRELTTRGSEWTPDYLPPSWHEKLASIREDFAKRFEPKPEEVSPDQNSRPIESVDELILQGLAVNQIKKIHKDVSISEILDKADKLGVKMPDAANLASFKKEKLAERIDAQEKEQERRFEAAKLAEAADSLSELSTLYDKVVWLNGKGLAPKEIVDALHGEHSGLSHQKVSHLIRKHKEAKEAT